MKTYSEGIKICMSIAVYVIWILSGVITMLIGMFVYEQDGGWLIASIICVVISVSLWYFGKKLYNKFTLKPRLYWIVTGSMLLFVLILIADSPLAETFFGMLAVVAFTILGIIETRKQPATATASPAIPNMSMERQYMHRLENLSLSIDKPQFKSQVLHLHAICKQILDFAENNQAHAYNADTFKDYYLPKIVQLLEKYTAFSNHPVKSENVISSIARIESSVESMKKIFEHCLNSLYGEIAQDVDNDIDVLEQMMKLEGIDEV